MKCAKCKKVRATGVISGYDGETTYCSLACAGISRAHLATRYYLLNTFSHDPASHGLFADLRSITTEIQYFRGGVGEMYAKITGVFDPTCDNNVKDVEDILHNYRTKCPVIKEFKRKPRPEDAWKGTWINFYQIQKHYEHSIPTV